jgi:putative membrane protein
MMFDGMWGWHWLGMAFFWLVPIALIALFVFALSRWTVKSDNRTNETAIDILEKRYAKGEINEQEFERMKKALSHV